MLERAREALTRALTDYACRVCGVPGLPRRRTRPRHEAAEATPCTATHISRSRCSSNPRARDAYTMTDRSKRPTGTVRLPSQQGEPCPLPSLTLRSLPAGWTTAGHDVRTRGARGAPNSYRIAHTHPIDSPTQGDRGQRPHAALEARADLEGTTRPHARGTQRLPDCPKQSAD